jgi:peptidoglycan/xylan/chitin deacetylase (PgdA/CDA1 family)
VTGILCVGYDVERGDPGVTRHFLKAMTRIHRERNVPCTLFITGQTLERNVDLFRSLLDDPLFDLQQHTYSHLIFHEAPETSDGVTRIYGRNETLETVKNDIEKASQVFRTVLNHEVIGLTTPYGFFEGLKSRPDILRVLWDAGIRYVRSYLRNQYGFNPVGVEIQPFFYQEQGFPEMLECPSHGWQDCIWRARFGYTAPWQKQVSMYLDLIKEHDWYFGLLQHDWASIKKDRKMEKTAAILDYALAQDIKCMHYTDFYRFKLHGKLP